MDEFEQESVRIANDSNAEIRITQNKKFRATCCAAFTLEEGKSNKQIHDLIEACNSENLDLRGKRLEALGKLISSLHANSALNTNQTVHEAISKALSSEQFSNSEKITDIITDVFAPSRSGVSGGGAAQILGKAVNTTTPVNQGRV